ncbi:ABC transporter permease [Clostridioides difficile]|uniref:ABC transporter permease n=1 Tax=Clostridioides difficile TaxID=1496 RepID=UPI001FADFC33|nr:ABC transporter permease [Clostridioides difficile]MCJ0222631.1 ABC transporter permease [Clostridioides difficile]MCJ0429685.1 ABC transporter permease [Clostridioides difficile]MCJ0435677.1 ABC transporter permease [Clostridioides difficile]MCU6147968.1 ABC transporter permease [Clostridioides difficile]
MGIYLKMSLAYLKKDKLRTSLLVLGVVLGVVLIFGMSVIKDSQNKNDLDAIHKLYGGYHVECTDLNLESIEKLKSDENVSKITTVQNLGRVVDKKGNSVLLKSMNRDYLTGKSSRLIKGRLPKSSNEIVMEKKAIEAMNISDTLNSTISLTVKKEYKDSNGSNKIYTIDKEFKLVGVIEKPKGYYDYVYELEAFTYESDETNNIIPQDTISYNSILSLKTGWKNIRGQAENIMRRHNIGRYSCIPNSPLMVKTMEIEENINPDVFKREVLIIITASIFIFNIFNITLNETIREMGLLRLIGSSKKNVKCIIIYQALIIMIVGIIGGLILGVTFSYIGINSHNIQLYEQASINPKLYVSNANIIKAIIIGVFSVIISSVIPIWKIGKISPIEATNKVDKVKKYRESYKLNKLLSRIFGFYGFMGLKNIGRNKGRAFISMISIALGGYVFITTFSSMQGEVSNKIEDIYNKYDITMEFVGAISDVDNLKYTDNDVNKIRNIDGVKSINKIQVESGVFEFKKNEINKEFTKHNGIQENDTMEYDMNLKFYENDYINKTLKKFVQKGTLDDIDKMTSGYPNIAVYNYYYDEVDDHTYENVFEDVKVGDIITIKVPITENNKTLYKESKVRVCATLNPDWAFKGDGGPGRKFEVITSNKHAKYITGEQKYTKLGINLEDSYNETVNKEVEEISNSIHLSKFDSRLSFKEMGKTAHINYIKSQISIILLVLIIAGVNIFCTIRTSLLMRKKEISTLRAIGLSVKNMKKMVIYEALAYTVLSFIIALIPSIVNLIKFVNWNNNAYKNFGIEHFMSFTFPIKESIIFFIISIIVCLIGVITSNRDFKKMNIIEGIKDND